MIYLFCTLAMPLRRCPSVFCVLNIVFSNEMMNVVVITLIKSLLLVKNVNLKLSLPKQMWLKLGKNNGCFHKD